MFYRFKNGLFQEASNFEEAKTKLIEEINSETEDVGRWHKCTCLGLSHRYDCPEYVMPL